MQRPAMCAASSGETRNAKRSRYKLRHITVLEKAGGYELRARRWSLVSGDPCCGVEGSKIAAYGAQRALPRWPASSLSRAKWPVKASNSNGGIYTEGLSKKPTRPGGLDRF